MFSAYTLRQLRDDVSVMAGEKESRANIDGYCHSTSGRMRDYWHDALEIKETADKGRGVFAKEKLKAGTVVCRSLPLAACLKLNTRDKETGTFSNEYCAACFKSSQRLGAPPYTLCGACTQYFCSQACKSHSNHAVIPIEPPFLRLILLCLPYSFPSPLLDSQRASKLL